MKQVITSNFFKMKDCLKKLVLWPGLCLKLYLEAGWTVTRIKSHPIPTPPPPNLSEDCILTSGKNKVQHGVIKPEGKMTGWH